MKKIMCVMLSLLPLLMWGQDEVMISADRPGMATGTGTMPKGKVQWEAGMGLDSDKGGEATAYNLTFANSLWRYGITDRWEVRLELDGVHQWCGEEKATGLAPVIVGTKFLVYEGEGAKPNVGVMANVMLPVASKAFKPSHVAPSVYVMADHDVSNRVNLCYNAGVEWDGELTSPYTFAAVCMGYSINDRWGCFVESYNYFHKDMKAQWNADLGVSYLVNKRVQLDASAAFNLNHIKDYYNVSLGVAWLIN